MAPRPDRLLHVSRTGTWGCHWTLGKSRWRESEHQLNDGPLVRISRLTQPSSNLSSFKASFKSDWATTASANLVSIFTKAPRESDLCAGSARPDGSDEPEHGESCSHKSIFSGMVSASRCRTRSPPSEYSRTRP